MSYDNPRIRDLSASPMQIMMDFAEGNPGAITALCELVKAAPTVDPDSAFGAMCPLFSLDNLDCYGSRIWVFYKDVCQQNASTMLALMRANQFGFIGTSELSSAIDDRGRGLDVEGLVAKVRERLPRFDGANRS